MKSLVKLILVVLVLSVVLIGCQNKDILGPKTPDQSTVVINDSKALTTYPIWAGQNILAGQMSVWNDVDYFYVKYETTGGWMLEETHVHITDSPYNVPNNGNNPVPGSFAYSTTHNPTVNEHTYQIPRTGYTFVTGDTICIAAHCSVVNDDYMGGGYQQETGWGGDQEGWGSRWWYYMWYVVNGNGGGGGDYYETAMVRMYDSPTDFTYRWKMATGKFHPWFSYVKLYPALTPQTFYFYAGQSMKCGEVDIWKEGDFLKVQIDMMGDWEMTASHVKVKLSEYRESPAFGNFPYKDYHDPAATTYTYSIPWDEMWNGMQLNIAVHGDVQMETEE